MRPAQGAAAKGEQPAVITRDGPSVATAAESAPASIGTELVQGEHSEYNDEAGPGGDSVAEAVAPSKQPAAVAADVTATDTADPGALSDFMAA